MLGMLSTSAEATLGDVTSRPSLIRSSSAAALSSQRPALPKVVTLLVTVKRGSSGFGIA